MSNPKIPNDLKELRGTNRADRQKPILAGERLTEPPTPPDTLSAGARLEWLALAHQLVELGTVCRGDLRAFAVLCEILATANALQAVIEAEGILIKTGTGSFKTNPAQRSLETARNQATRLFTEFGLTPKARNYVTAAPEHKDPEASGFQTQPR